MLLVVNLKELVHVYKKKNDLTEISELISGGPAWRGRVRSWRFNYESCSQAKAKQLM
jgi:hypothetical protein